MKSCAKFLTFSGKFVVWHKSISVAHFLELLKIIFTSFLFCLKNNPNNKSFIFSFCQKNSTKKFPNSFFFSKTKIKKKKLKLKKKRISSFFLLLFLSRDGVFTVLRCEKKCEKWERKCWKEKDTTRKRLSQFMPVLEQFEIQKSVKRKHWEIHSITFHNR